MTNKENKKTEIHDFHDLINRAVELYPTAKKMMDDTKKQYGIIDDDSDSDESDYENDEEFDDFEYDDFDYNEDEFSPILETQEKPQSNDKK
jgi:hypothetical protein